MRNARPPLLFETRQPNPICRRYPVARRLLPLCLAAAMQLCAAGAATSAARAAEAAATPAEMTMEVFLDRLMHAESGGNDRARNPGSTALGPYQFIASTWLMLTHRYFKDETAALSAAEVLALRTNREMARRAAEAYSRDNAAYLVANGHTPAFQNLRLAFLVGPGGAVRILSAPEETRVGALLGPGVIGSNPFMSNLTAGGLIARTARDIATDPRNLAGVTPDPSRVFAEIFSVSATSEFAGAGAVAQPVAREMTALLQNFAASTPVRQALAQSAAPPKAARPKIEVDCDLSRSSCRRWLALAERKVRRIARRAVGSTD